MGSEMCIRDRIYSPYSISVRMGRVSPFPCRSKAACALDRYVFLLGQACLRTTSQSGLRPPAPLVGEPLAYPESFTRLPKPPLVRSNNDDRRQWRKQGVAVGAAASKTQAKRCGCWVPQPGQWHPEGMTERFSPTRTSKYGTRTAAAFPSWLRCGCRRAPGGWSGGCPGP
mgnify:CR=1 FL=1